MFMVSKNIRCHSWFSEWSWGLLHTIFEPVFESIKDRVWKEIFFSMCGNQVLIKVVTQAIVIVIYTVCVKLAKSLYDEICQMFAKFWWWSSKEKGKIHWRSWSRMCYCKMMVATSSMAFIFFNQVVVAKQSWRIVNRPHYLLAQVIRGKYFRIGNFLKAALGYNLHAWQSIL